MTQFENGTGKKFAEENVYLRDLASVRAGPLAEAQESVPNGARYPNQLVGSLYRFHQRGDIMQVDQVIRNHNLLDNGTDYQKIADGIVHLRLRAISPEDSGRALWHEPVFRGAHVPLYVEVEFGLLEDGLLRDMEARAEQELPGSDERVMAKYNVMKENLDRIHMFRQIVPIRNSRHFGFAPAKTTQHATSSPQIASGTPIAAAS